MLRRTARGPLLAACLTTTLLAPAAAEAAFPGPNGKLAYVTPKGLDFRLMVVDPDGTGATPVTDHEGSDFSPAWAPGGKKLVYVHSPADGDREIRVIDWATGADVAVTADDAHQHEPAFSPDGARIVFEEGGDLWTMAADGTDRRQVTSGDAHDEQPTWSPDGATIAFMRTLPSADPDVHVVAAEGGIATPMTNNGSDEGTPDWRPDGSGLAFYRAVSSESAGLDEELHTLASGGTARLTFSDGVDREPTWSPDGTKLAFRSQRAVDGSSFARLFVLGDGAQAPLNPALNAFSPAWGSALTPRGGGTQDPPKQDPPKEEPRRDGPAPEPRTATVVALPATTPSSAPSQTCASRRAFTIRLRLPRGERLQRARVFVDGKAVPVRRGARHTASVDLRRLPKGRFVVRIRVRTASGRTFTEVRRYRTCTPRPRA